MPSAHVIDVDGESVCCRASDDIYPDCGYAACTELTELRSVRPSAVLGMLTHVREQFRLKGDTCIETNPTDVDDATVRKLHEADVALVSLGVQSFRPENLQ